VGSVTAGVVGRGIVVAVDIGTGAVGIGENAAVEIETAGATLRGRSRPRSRNAAPHGRPFVLAAPGP